MRLSAMLLAGAGCLVLTACSPAPEAPAEPVAEAAQAPYGPGPDHVEGEPFDAVVSGAATWEGGTLPETARLIVEVRDLTRPPEGGDLLLKEEFPVTPGSPAAFSGTVSKFDLIPGGNLVLRARIQDGYAILLTSDGDVDIADSGETAGLDVPLLNPEDLARGRPAQMITPEGKSYVCGGEALIIALEAGAAYVTFTDGTSVKLDLIEPAIPTTFQFTNGRFVVESRQGTLGPPEIFFGRGRAALSGCLLAG